MSTEQNNKPGPKLSPQGQPGQETPAENSDQQAVVVGRRRFLKQAAWLSGGLLAYPALATLAQAQPLRLVPPGMLARASNNPPKTQASAWAYQPLRDIEAQNFEAQFARVEGLSASQLKQHNGLYLGYVKKANEIHRLIRAALPDPATANATYDPFRELHVEASYAMNGIILHELYFGNLGQPAQGPNQPSDALKEAITREYGSWQAYLTHLRALGKSMRGWVLSAFNIRDGRIHNYGLDTHNQWVPIHVIPFIVLDVYEHAYMLDFGTNRGSYLDVFFNNLNWPAVNQRFASLPFHGT